MSINICRKPIKLYFETLSLSLVTFPGIAVVFHACRPHPVSALVLDQPLIPLVTSGAASPRVCLIALFHHFLSARLPTAEAGGISEPRLKTPRFLPRACFLLLVF